MFIGLLLAAIWMTVQQVRTHNLPPVEYVSAGVPIALTFPGGWYENTGEHPFDLQAFSKDEQMNTALFVYACPAEERAMLPRQNFNFHLEDIQSKREHFELLEEESQFSHAGKTITSVTYSAEHGKGPDFYRFSLLQFDHNPEVFGVVLQIAVPTGWGQAKPIFDEILKSAALKL